MLLFPPLPSRLRYLIHNHVEELPDLTTFSVGERECRRVAVCYADLRYFIYFTSSWFLFSKMSVTVLYCLVPHLCLNTGSSVLFCYFKVCEGILFFEELIMMMMMWEMQTQTATASGMNLLQVRRGNMRKRLLTNQKHQTKPVTEDRRGRTNPSTCHEQCERDCHYRTHNNNPPKTKL